MVAPELRRSTARRATSTAAPRRARSIPIHRTIPRLARDPLSALAEIGHEANGTVVRLNLGMFRPFLVTSPDDVQFVLRDGTENYVRDGMIWRPLRRLNGDGIASDGPQWQISRRRLQPLFRARDIDAMIDSMSTAVAEALDTLESQVGMDTPFDAFQEMTRVVHRVLVRLFFGDRIAVAEADRLGEAINTAFTSLSARMLMPFVPNSIPMPGDGAFRQAVRTVEEVISPLARQRGEAPAAITDMVSRLGQLRDADGGTLPERDLLDDLKAMFVAGTETTALALTWFWTVLGGRPDIADALSSEIRAVVGQEQPTRAHLAKLQYTKMVLQETLRLYPSGWIVPRTVRQKHVLGGATIPRGATVLISPYVTHRMSGLWERPTEFDPERFAPDRVQGRHRYAYYPFGGGEHMCLGSHLFTVEAQLIIASIFSRYQPRLCSSSTVEPRAAITLRPSQPVRLMLSRL